VLEIKKKHYGEDHIDNAITMENLSNILNILRDYKGAE
jgi:hypothetical protein